MQRGTKRRRYDDESSSAAAASSSAAACNATDDATVRLEDPTHAATLLASLERDWQEHDPSAAGPSIYVTLRAVAQEGGEAVDVIHVGRAVAGALSRPLKHGSRKAP